MKPSKKSLIIAFDADDTLFATSRHYHRVMWPCGAIIDSALGARSPHPKEILDYQETVDIAAIKNAPHAPYAPSRFANSWLNTYRHFAEKYGVRVKSSVLKELRQTALGYKQGPYVPFRNTLKTLRWVRRRGHHLHCITAGLGADRHQLDKLIATGCSTFFESVRVTGVDKTEAMRGLFTPRTRSVMVGDSLRHDIAPANRLGVMTVHVPSTSWSFIHARSKPTYSISCLSQLPAIIEQIESTLR